MTAVSCRCARLLIPPPSCDRHAPMVSSLGRDAPPNATRYTCPSLDVVAMLSEVRS